ncbi:hypothetical protein [Thiocystis violascens]|uniref:Uncharacterized protein n=1 Tax=Thiocystis violascens (strain ATCC 17096 / DSM 198 / 6111) TaxID=765911 RepID=I3Y9C0_THIV6|nr:hypothetical protein [Thiocystis violascens]AFL73588.1 hypothetical protein Thivi_1601 [Thiocystis violascens DSM 198]
MSKPCPADVILQFVVEQIHEGHYERVLALGFNWEQILRCWEQFADRPLGERYLETAQAVRVTVRQVRGALARHIHQAAGAEAEVTRPPSQQGTGLVPQPVAAGAR